DGHEPRRRPDRAVGRGRPFRVRGPGHAADGAGVPAGGRHAPGSGRGGGRRAGGDAQSLAEARQLSPGSAFRPWFFTIVANHCRDLRRSRWWSVLRGIDAERPAAAVDLAGGIDLRRALAELPVHDRALLVLHYYLDLSLEEAARVLGVSPAAGK